MLSMQCLGIRVLFCVKVRSQNSVERLRKTTKMADNWTEIRTKHLQNTSLQYCHYINPLETQF